MRFLPHILPQRVPLLPTSAADLRCTLYPQQVQVLQIKVKLIAFVTAILATLAMVLLGHDAATAVAAVTGCGLAAAEISARLLGTSALTGRTGPARALGVAR